MRRTIVLIASVAISVFFLWLALRGVPLTDVIARIREASVPWLIISFITIIAALWARAVRWRGLLGFQMPLLRAFYILCVTFLLNQLPLRAGEVARSLLATRSGVPIVTAATSIVVERLLDTVMVVLLVAVALSRVPAAPPAVAQVAVLFGIASVLAFVALVLLARNPVFADRLALNFEQRIPLLARLRVRTLLDHALDGLQPLTAWRSAVHAIGWTVIAWGISCVTFYALEMALRVSGVDLLLLDLLAVSLAAFSIAIPVSVASIGPFEGAVRLAGEAMGTVSPDVATSLGFLYHGVIILTYAVLGAIALLALGVSLGEVMNNSSKAQASAD